MLFPGVQCRFKIKFKLLSNNLRLQCYGNQIQKLYNIKALRTNNQRQYFNMTSGFGFLLNYIAS